MPWYFPPSVWPLVRASWTVRVKVRQCGHWQKHWRRLWKMSATFFVSSVSVETPATSVAWTNCSEKGCRRRWRFLIASLLTLNCATWARWCLWSRLRNTNCSSSLLFCSQRHSRGTVAVAYVSHSGRLCVYSYLWFVTGFTKFWNTVRAALLCPLPCRFTFHIFAEFSQVHELEKNGIFRKIEHDQKKSLLLK